VELIANYDLLIITGPTASGKTSLAVAIAKKVGGEIISADSRQVYRGMNIGTGKDYDDYLIDGSRIPCHLIDIADPGYKYNVFEYQRDFIRVYNSLKDRRVFPVVCGGSGMYADSIISGYRMVEVAPDSGLRSNLEKKSMGELIEILSTYKKLHNTTDLDTKKRVIRAIEIEHFNQHMTKPVSKFPEIRSLVVGILPDRESRRINISKRLKQRLDSGMIDEVKHLIDQGLKPDILIYYGLEYKYITLYLTGKVSYEDMVRDLEIAIHQFAKRQMTWFRSMEKRGVRINWLDGKLSLEDKINGIMLLLNSSPHPQQESYNHITNSIPAGGGT
jgi:tRNA dimethylallyltransferase